MEQRQHLEFRFYYFTNKYNETVLFYRDLLRWTISNSWDRGPLDKGTVFESPNGLGRVEVEEGTTEPILQCGLYVQVNDVARLHAALISRNVKINTQLATTSYGHQKFELLDPNGLSISFFAPGSI